MDVHILTSELLEIRKYLDRKGEDITLNLANGLRFQRVNDICYIDYPGAFSMVVDRLKVGKGYVMFENSHDDLNHIYISRNKGPFY